jgi:arylsulfatase A-like enzyme
LQDGTVPGAGKKLGSTAGFLAPFAGLAPWARAATIPAMRTHLFLFLLGLALFGGGPPKVLAAGQARHFVLVVWDGMRPDFVSPELTPALWSLRTNGVWFAQHHAAYPTSTEVNSTALATGGFPARSGILGKGEFWPSIHPFAQFPTTSLAAVRRGDALSGGNYLGLPTVAELAQAAGQRTAVAGAKTVALLHDRRARDDEAQSWVWFAAGALPESKLALLTARFGPFPAAATPNLARDTWATRCLTEAFWAGELPRYSVLWLSEPDLSQHTHGPGSSEALAAIRGSDARLAVVLAELDRRGVRGQTDVLVVSDHGFSTIAANVDATAALRAAGINARSAWYQPPQAGDVVVAGNGGSVLLYVIGRGAEVTAKLVRTLQQQPFVGVLFTRDPQPGTFPLAEAMLGTPNAPDVVISSRWVQPSPTNSHPLSLVFNDGYDEFDAGCGMHMTLCPTDLRNVAVAAGPDFRRGVESALPSGNVDIAPTLLWLMGLKPSKPLDGRVLSEALSAPAPAVGKVSSDRREAVADLGHGRWQQYLKFTELNGVRYLDEGNGGWTPSAVPGAKAAEK